jgi:alginate O-acetyltransferase complex protein AlgI
MLLGGLWHGAGWTFVIWGLLHGLFLVINHAWFKSRSRLPFIARVSETPGYKIATWLLTQICVVVAWVFFRSENMEVAIGMLSAMAGMAPAEHLSINVVSQVVVIAGAFLACVAMPNVYDMFAEWNVGLKTYRNNRRWSIVSLNWRPNFAWAGAAAAALLASLFVSLIAGEVSPFLYFQF